MLSRVRMHGTKVCDRACTCHRTAADILKASGISLDELPATIQARLVARASAEGGQNNTGLPSYDPVDPEGAYSNNPPSGPREANARYSQRLADLNRKNADFWSRQ